MKIESTVTAVSWIPAGTVKGLAKPPFSLGLTHYDEEPPALIQDKEALLRDERFREVNVLRAWIEVEQGKIVGYGQSGAGHVASTALNLGLGKVAVKGHALPALRYELDVNPDYVTFAQTVGGRTGMPFPRPVRKAPFLQYHSAIAWSTLALTLHANGRVERELIGASPFPRHYLYDDDGRLIGDTVVTDFKAWFGSCFGRRTPWRGMDNRPQVRAILVPESPATAIA